MIRHIFNLSCVAICVSAVRVRRSTVDKLTSELEKAEKAEALESADEDAAKSARASLKGDEAKFIFEQFAVLNEWSFEKAGEWGKLFPNDCSTQGMQSPVNFEPPKTEVKVQPLPLDTVSDVLDQTVVEAVYTELTNATGAENQVRKGCNLSKELLLQATEEESLDGESSTPDKTEAEAQKEARKLEAETGAATDNQKTDAQPDASAEDNNAASRDGCQTPNDTIGYLAPWNDNNGQLVAGIGYYSQLGYLNISGKSFAPNMVIVKSPSEHKVGGKSFAGELQFVFVQEGKENSENMADKKDRMPLLGISVFLNAKGKDAPPASENSPGDKKDIAAGAFLAVTGADDAQPASPVSTKFLNPDGILLAELHLKSVLSQATRTGYYGYTGTLTAPPCVSNVHWIVGRGAVDVDEDTLNEIKQVAKSRPSQDLGDRKVRMSTLPDFSSALRNSALMLVLVPFMWL